MNDASLPRAIMHCDMDAFYVAVHRMDHPEHRGIPLVVGGSPEGRGVVASASYEARRFGVRSAMPTARALRLCPELVVVPADWARIKERSRRVMDALSAFGPLEAMSVDEAYVDVTEALGSVLSEREGRWAARPAAQRGAEASGTGTATTDDRGGTDACRAPDAPRDRERERRLRALAVQMGALPMGAVRNGAVRERAVRGRAVHEGVVDSGAGYGAGGHERDGDVGGDGGGGDGGTCLGPEDPAFAFAERVRRAVVEATGLPASVGLSTSKGVAKVASDFDKPEGVTVVPPGQEAAFLAPMPVRALHGVGPRTEERLKGLGIVTCAQLAEADDALLRERFGAHGVGLRRRARGEDRRGVSPERGPAKQISAERTFAEDVDDREVLRRKVEELAAEVAGQLERRGVVARTVVVKFRWADFTTFTRQRTLEVAVGGAEVLGRVAWGIWEAHWRGEAVRLVGVGVRKMGEGEGQGQLMLGL